MISQSRCNYKFWDLIFENYWIDMLIELTSEDWKQGQKPPEGVENFSNTSLTQIFERYTNICKANIGLGHVFNK